MKEEGRLTRWNDDRGFGFITPSTGKSDVFVHISVFPKDGYRPKIGERLIFAVEVGKDGKKRAVNLGCPERPKNPASSTYKPRNTPYRTSKKKRGVLGLIWGMIVLVGAGVYAYSQSGRTLPFQSPSVIQESQQAETSSFRCDGRTHCSQMRSCGEAKFFLKYCPGVKMDGNNDGVPCEKQWCH